MRSHNDETKPEAAPEQLQPPSQPAPAPPRPGPAPTKPGLSLEERVARLEQKLVPLIGEL